MIVRNCAGGIVFCGDKVLMLLNDKHEWAFPKGVVRAGQKLTDIAIKRIKIEAGVDASIVAPCGKTKYEFFSVTRKKPVHNNVSWFVMRADSEATKASEADGFSDAKFFTMEEALDTITYSQDKSLLMMAYQRYRELS
ncbi:ADP-ribose pyrophosphatase YjhB, NUDIX family [Oscillospiraceae bacterium]|nr:ADP-ribose pyrophosphatase YjhB, NUDIX family [Oscillospiraceae bacterium]